MSGNKFLKFGTRLKALREEQRVNQASLAEALGITRQSMSNYESGKHSPDIDVIERMAEYFECSTDYLFGRSPFKSHESMKSYDQAVEVTFNETLKLLSTGEREYFLERITAVIDSFRLLQRTPYHGEYYERIIDLLAYLPTFAEMLAIIYRVTPTNKPIKLSVGNKEFVTLDSRSVEYIRILEKKLQTDISEACEKVVAIGGIGFDILDKHFPESQIILNASKDKSRRETERGVEQLNQLLALLDSTEEESKKENE
ncbi:MAG: XRE family transcriptional regulator [Clostridia bacterium]|nr:XRE family transcriptional regulator [Clostridia bacterium]